MSDADASSRLDELIDRVVSEGRRLGASVEMSEILGGAKRTSRRSLATRVSVIAVAAALTVVAIVVPLSVSTRGKPTPLFHPVVTATSSTAYLIGQQGRTQTNVLIPLHLAADTLGRRLVLPGEGGVAIAPGGKIALVVDSVDDRVYPFDLATDRAERPVPTGPRPVDVAFSPDGKTAFVADVGADGCAIPGQNCHTRSDLVTPINLAGDVAERPIRTCPGPEQVAIDPSGRHLWVACYFDGVDEVSITKSKVVHHYDVPGSPGNIAFADGGRTVIVGQILVEDLQGGRDNFVVLIHPFSGTESKPIRVGSEGGPSVAAVTPEGVAYISAWAKTVPGDMVTTAIAPLNLTTGQVGQFLRIPPSHEPVAFLGYWGGLGVRFLTYPKPTYGDVWEGAPGSAATRTIHTPVLRFTPGMGNAQLLGLDPYSPYVVAASRASVAFINLATGRAEEPVRLRGNPADMSVAFVPGAT